MALILANPLPRYIQGRSGRPADPNDARLEDGHDNTNGESSWPSVDYRHTFRVINCDVNGEELSSRRNVVSGSIPGFYGATSLKRKLDVDSLVTRPHGEQTKNRRVQLPDGTRMTESCRRSGILKPKSSGSAKRRGTPFPVRRRLGSDPGDDAAAGEGTQNQIAVFSSSDDEDDSPMALPNSRLKRKMAEVTSSWSSSHKQNKTRRVELPDVTHVAKRCRKDGTSQAKSRPVRRRQTPFPAPRDLDDDSS